MDELLRELLLVPGVSGCEERVRAVVGRHLPPGVTGGVDAMGNLVATLGGGDEAILFAAHMDEIGFVVSDVREDGFLRLKPVGGIDPRTVLGHVLRVVTREGELLGVVGVNPPHLMRDRAKEMGAVPEVTEMYVDIGAKSREEALALGVALLDFAVLEKAPCVVHGRRLVCRGLDDRIGCWILLKAMHRLREETFARKVHFAFTVQEEVGLRGAQVLARRMDLTHVFAVDSASAADYPMATRDLSPALLGGGACLRVFDNASIIPPAFTREIEGIARDAGIPCQVIFGGGGTDVGAFQYGGARSMPLGIPMRYTHAAVEMVDEGDVEATLDLVCALALRYGS